MVRTEMKMSGPSDDTGQPWCREPSEVALETPSVARVYDAYLGGGANLEADRAFANDVRAILPDVQELAVANRCFLARAIRFGLSQGVNQFLDIGAGIPSAVWSTHGIAHSRDLASRVVYVDHEAVAYASLREATDGDPRLGAVRADFRDVDSVLWHPVTTRVLDLTRPVMMLLGLLLHFVPDSDDPAGLLARYRHQVATGSYVAISHDTADGREADMLRVAQLYAHMGRPLVLREHAAIVGLLDGFEWIPPGIVHMPLWRPEPDVDNDPVIDPPDRSCVYAAVVKT